MNTTIMTTKEIREQGLQAPPQKLGTAGMIKFFQQFEIGSGDYTKERKKILK
ncbi:MAG: hypothetical protein KGZ58_03235 [Ignavibacteriales bacterium]|nr:hypothetical protein [Ignavibacteriales bacterium]